MSESSAVWYQFGDTAACRTCGGDVAYDGQYWLHLGTMGTGFHAADIIHESVRRETAVNGEAQPYPPSWDDIEPLPNYDEWLGMMASAGWFGSMGNGWVTVRPIPRTMSHNEAMELFRLGLCPSFEDNEPLPFSEPVGESWAYTTI